MGYIPTADHPQSVSTYIGAFTGSSSTEVPLWRAPCPCVITGASLMVTTTVTGHTQNYGTATVYNCGTAGSGTTSVAAKSSNSTLLDITAKVPWALTLSTTSADLEMATGEMLSFKFTEAGTGQDLVNAVVQIDYVPGTGAGYSA